MNEFLQRMFNFFVVNDFPTLLESIRHMKWGDVAKTPLLWLIGIPVLIALLWTKSYKLITALASLAALVVLLHYTLPPAGDKIPLHDLVIFSVGALALALLNLYLFFVRD